MNRFLSILFVGLLGFSAHAVAQGDIVTVGPTQTKVVQPTQAWRYANGAWQPVDGVVTPTLTAVTTSGTVAAGSRGLTFIFRAGFAGTVLGVAFSATTDASFSPAIPPGCVCGAVPYTVTAGTLYISDSR